MVNSLAFSACLLLSHTTLSLFYSFMSSPPGGRVLQPVPRHVALIMDGNGRWAEARGLSRLDGHLRGVSSLRSTVEEAARMGIGYLTFYTFSTENWNRSTEEVDGLMALLGTTIDEQGKLFHEKNARFRAIGDITKLPEHTRQKISALEQTTAANTAIQVAIALNYGAKWEILRAVNQIVAAGKPVDEQEFENHLCTAAMPNPELLIRTGGERRLSNFLLYQCAYTELYFTDVYWPDFSADHFAVAIQDYRKRQRRFGG